MKCDRGSLREKKNQRQPILFPQVKNFPLTVKRSKALQGNKKNQSPKRFFYPQAYAQSQAILRASKISYWFYLHFLCEEITPKG